MFDGHRLNNARFLVWNSTSLSPLDAIMWPISSPSLLVSGAPSSIFAGAGLEATCHVDVMLQISMLPNVFLILGRRGLTLRDACCIQLGLDWVQ